MAQGLTIDAHVHLFPPDFIAERARLLEREPYFHTLFSHPHAPMGSLEELLSVMQRDGVAVSVLCGFPWRDGGRARAHNQYLLEVSRSHPGCFVPLAAVDPLSPAATGEAARALGEGAAGLGEIGCYHDDVGAPGVLEKLIELGELCAEAKKPLLLHANEPVGHRYAGKSPMTLAGLEKLLAACPGTRFQLAHLGGGIFFFLWLRRGIKKLLENCITDTAALPFLFRSQALRYLAESGVRIAFGSDWPLLAPERYRREFERAGLSAERLLEIRERVAAGFWQLGGD